jgi:hypothetical protein
MSEIGVYGSATYAQTLSGIEEMLSVVEDNTANSISAQDMRNVVYTLYDEIQGASYSEFVYTDTPSNVDVGGLTSGTIFASMSLFEIFNRMFHKDRGPTVDLTSNGSVDYDYKAASYNEVSVSFNYKITQGTKALRNAIFERTTTPTGTISEPVLPPLSKDDFASVQLIKNQTNSFNFTCYDVDGRKASDPISFNYKHRVYWGKVTTRDPLTSLQIRALDGASLSGSGNFRSLSFTGVVQGTPTITFPNIDGKGQFLAFAWPSSYGVPKFRTATGIVTIADRVQFGANLPGVPNSNFKYKNLYDYEEPYDVWITFQQSNEPIAQLDLF